MIEFDLSRAVLLTYVGVSAAFVVLGSLIVFTALLGWWGRWRRRVAVAREAEAAEASPVAVEAAAQEEPAAADPRLAAAIAAAVALAVEEEQRERREMERRSPEHPAADGEGWKGQGRVAAFDARRLRDRER